MSRFVLAAALTGGLALALAPAASAATLPGADMHPGQAIAAGVLGASYDYTFPSGTLVGVVLGNHDIVGTASRLKLGGRIYQQIHAKDGLSAAVIGGLELDPGVQGGRAYLVPDLGVGLAYRFAWAMPLTVRVAFTATYDQGQRSAYYGSYGTYLPTTPDVGTSSLGSVLQRVTWGPNTTIGVGLEVSPGFELTLGSGNWVGMRLRF